LKLATCARPDISAPGFLLRPALEPSSMTTPKPTAPRGPGGRPITRALIAALEESAPGADAPNLRRIVENLIGKAIDGDLAAIREIFDRIDGKAPSAPAGAGAQEPRKVMFEWKSTE
jgi:hypothetical protein